MNINELIDPIQYNTVLNPKLWNNDVLKAEVRGALLRIAEDFIKFVDVPMNVVDIVIYGGNVNYNYTAKSDLDLHIVVDMNSIECDRETEELFDSKRRLYKEKYDIKVQGIEVELYVEDTENTPVSASYSILKDQWIKKPNPNLPEYDKEEVMKMTETWVIILIKALKTNDLQKIRDSLQLLRKYRTLGLKTKQAEFSTPNLVFKALRNLGVLDTMSQVVDKLHDINLSYPQQ